MQLFQVPNDATEELIEVNPPVQFESNDAFIFVDDSGRKIWLWIGQNARVRTKFMAARRAQEIRQRTGLTYKTETVDHQTGSKGFTEFLFKNGIPFMGEEAKPEESEIQKMLKEEPIRTEKKRRITTTIVPKAAEKTSTNKEISSLSQFVEQTRLKTQKPSSIGAVPKKAPIVGSTPKKTSTITSTPKKAPIVGSAPKRAPIISSVPKTGTSIRNPAVISAKTVAPATKDDISVDLANIQFDFESTTAVLDFLSDFIEKWDLKYSQIAPIESRRVLLLFAELKAILVRIERMDQSGAYKHTPQRKKSAVFELLEKEGVIVPGELSREKIPVTGKSELPKDPLPRPTITKNQKAEIKPVKAQVKPKKKKLTDETIGKLRELKGYMSGQEIKVLDSPKKDVKTKKKPLKKVKEPIKKDTAEVPTPAKDEKDKIYSVALSVAIDAFEQVKSKKNKKTLILTLQTELIKAANDALIIVDIDKAKGIIEDVLSDLKSHKFLKTKGAYWIKTGSWSKEKILANMA